MKFENAPESADVEIYYMNRRPWKTEGELQ